MGRSIDMEQKGCESSIHDHDIALPGKSPESLTAEIDSFSRSVLASGPPHSPVLIKSQKFIFFINHQNILPLTPSYCS